MSEIHPARTIYVVKYVYTTRLDGHNYGSTTTYDRYEIGEPIHAPFGPARVVSCDVRNAADDGGTHPLRVVR